MKDLLKKPVTIEKIEFWAATTIYVFAAFILLGNAVHINEYARYNPYDPRFSRNNIPFSYIKNYFLPLLCQYTVYYGSFILLNFFIIKSLAGGNKIILNLLLLLCLYFTAAVILSTADTWIKAYLFSKHSEQYVYHLVFKQDFVYALWVLLLFGFYSLAKHALSSLMLNFGDTFPSYSQATRDGVAALGIWILSIFLLLILRAELDAIMIWSELALFGISLYWYSCYSLIPETLAKGQELGTYLLKVIVLLLLSFFPVALLMFALVHRIQGPVIINIFNTGISLFVVAPFSWFLYQHRLKQTTELHGLKTALGNSSAKLDFLRSQINPHFLFNALNTLYGTSIQENAERTGEGIQKLGDMMRFMLQENLQEKIPLAREVDYLNNYIDLQKLRTETTPDILILTEIDGPVCGLEVAPMLLIPFVENAFKHGISLRETSHIKVSLQTKEHELFFDVYNSVHPKAGSDPEKNKSGIGLENVKQRLQLLYPNRYELIIRENANEFFIHLTMQL